MEHLSEYPSQPDSQPDISGGHITGLVHSTESFGSVDGPGIRFLVFLQGCPLRCRFCHNPDTWALTSGQALRIRADELLAQALRYRPYWGKSGGITVSGGEPLLQPDAADFLAEVKAMGFAVKLDTNGCHPDALADILDRRLADYVAMDIKNSLEKYPWTVGVPGFDTAPVERSARLLMEGPADYEFRTTLVRPFHEVGDMETIGRWLRGARRYYLQAFVDSGDLVGGGCAPFTPEEMEGFLQAARPFFQSAALRGL